MTTKEQQLAAQLLKLAAEHFGRHGCNDWDFPEDWSQTEREDFVREYHQWNGDPREYDYNDLDLPDYAVMGFLAAKLRGETKCKN